MMFWCSVLRTEKGRAKRKRCSLINLVSAWRVVAADSDGRPDLLAVLRRLGELEITSLMIEGGSTVNGTALASNLVDKVFLYYAPKILGRGSIPFAAGAGSMPSVPYRSSTVRLHRFGEDFAVEGYLRDPLRRMIFHHRGTEAQRKSGQEMTLSATLW